VTIVVGPIAEDDSYTTPYDTDVNSSVPGNDTYPTGSVFTKLTNPTNGVVTFNPDGTFNYNPNSGFTGVDVFTYQVCLPAPNGTLCDPATVTIVVGPLANDDNETTPYNTPVTADVKGNDTYPSGAVFNNTSNPSNGTLVFSSNGTYTYTPAPGFTGVDQFTYTVCLPAPNGTVCDAATVTIVVGPIAEDDSYTTPYDTDVNSSVPGNDTYPTGSVFTKLTDPTNGVVTFNPDGTFNYNPNSGFTGVDVFTYQVCLPAPNGTVCDPATVTIVVGPLANDDNYQTPYETPVTANVNVNDTYPVGATFNQLSNPSHGSVVFSSNGSFTYTPAPGYSGTDVFTYEVCMPAPNSTLCDPATVTITICPRAYPGLLKVCPAAFSGMMGTFNLNDAYSQVTGGVSGLSLSFYLSETDAVQGNNAIATPAAYSAGSGPVWVRVYNPVTGCAAVATVQLEVLEQSDDPADRYR
jgi:hypothetical protein